MCRTLKKLGIMATVGRMLVFLLCDHTVLKLSEGFGESVTPQSIRRTPKQIVCR